MKAGRKKRMKDHGEKPGQQSSKISRRDFIGSTIATTAAFTIVPHHVLGGNGYTAPSEKLNIACVGVHHMGEVDIRNLATENIVALCDVDDRSMAHRYEQFPNVPKYKDFRKMLEKEDKNIDAVLVSTPDHTHAVIAMMAMKMGKHVYCQKPLATNIFDIRKLTEAARKYKVVTQMGIQGHATKSVKMVVEIIKSGLIGKVSKVDLWSKSPVFPQGIDRPTDTPPVPKELDWDAWLGPVADRPYHPAYLPKLWRGWIDFGTGALGDMGCHIFDPAVWALDLGAPVSIEAMNSNFTRTLYGVPSIGETYPRASIVRYKFAARQDMPPVTITWHHGGLKPWRPEGMDERRSLPQQGGLYYGEKNTLLSTHTGGPRLIPESKMKGFKPPKPFLPQGSDHYQEWISACKGGPKPLADFDYSGPLTETVMLGNVAILTGKKLYWDSENMKITNVPEANNYLRREYRQGWTL